MGDLGDDTIESLTAMIFCFLALLLVRLRLKVLLEPRFAPEDFSSFSSFEDIELII